jgi:hypothetical protein
VDYAFVIITVQRESAPTLNGPYTTTVNENVPVATSSLIQASASKPSGVVVSEIKVKTLLQIRLF